MDDTLRWGGVSVCRDTRMNILGFGLPELLVIGVLALIFIGPEKLPDTIRQFYSVYRQVRSLGMEWRETVVKEIGTDVTDLTREVNEGLAAFGNTIQREVGAIDAELKDAEDAARRAGEPAQPSSVAAMSTTATSVPTSAPPESYSPEFPTLPDLPSAPAKRDDDDRGMMDYRPS